MKWDTGVANNPSRCLCRLLSEGSISYDLMVDPKGVHGIDILVSNKDTLKSIVGTNVFCLCMCCCCVEFIDWAHVIQWSNNYVDMDENHVNTGESKIISFLQWFSFK